MGTTLIPPFAAHRDQAMAALAQANRIRLRRAAVELAEVAPTRTLGALTARQRAGLAAVLRLRADQLSRHTRRNAA
jgi:hypothetical protein